MNKKLIIFAGLILFMMIDCVVLFSQNTDIVPVTEQDYTRKKKTYKDNLIFSIGVGIQSSEWHSINIDIGYNLKYFKIGCFYRNVTENNKKSQIVFSKYSLFDINYSYLFPAEKNHIIGLSVGEAYTTRYFYSDISAGLGYESCIRRGNFIKKDYDAIHFEKEKYNKICAQLKGNIGFCIRPLVTFLSLEFISAYKLKPNYITSVNLGLIIF